MSGNLVIFPEYRYPENQEPILLVYRGQRQIAIKLYALDKLSNLIDIALEAGIGSVSNIEYGLKFSQELKDKARLNALADAKHKAQFLAKEFGVKLGEVHRIDYRSRSK